MDILTNDGSGMSSWGARINTSHREPRRQDAFPEGCPAWAKPWNWLHYGVVVWDDALQRMEVVSFGEAVKLLDQLRATDTWKSEGAAITRKVSYPKHPEQVPTPRSRRKRAQPVSEPLAEKIEWIEVEEERIRLQGQAALDFYAFLETNEAQLRQRAEEDERQMREAMSRAYAYLFHLSHEKESQEIDIAARPFPWRYDAETLIWTCDLPPNRGTVKLTGRNFFWEGCIEQPDRFKHESPLFTKLGEALSWVEQELMKIQQEAADKASHTEVEKSPPLCISTITPEKRAQLAPFWIEPAALEPERITYRLIICLEHTPLSSKTREISFGKLFHYGEEYATPTVLARALHLDQSQVKIKQTVGLYTISSHVTYFQESLAAAQAQRLWDQSLIVQQQQAGKVIWAEYGCRSSGYTAHRSSAIG